MQSCADLFTCWKAVNVSRYIKATQQYFNMERQDPDSLATAHIKNIEHDVPSVL